MGRLLLQATSMLVTGLGKIILRAGATFQVLNTCDWVRFFKKCPVLKHCHCGTSGHILEDAQLLYVLKSSEKSGHLL